MPRSRVLSFMSQWGSGNRSPQTEESAPLSEAKASTSVDDSFAKPSPIDTVLPAGIDTPGPEVPQSASQPSRARGDSRIRTRPSSTIQAYQPPQIDASQDTPPELLPIFSYLNSHGNKLYQEGYFLKLHDLDTRGRPSAERVWVESFAQLVGTVLSLWDAAALDAAGEDGEVTPTFINLSDASIKMIESLPMNGAKGGSLQNVLSVSTAANNRYLLHFNSLSSLTQWTAGIRLAMFENATLQEAYTGSLIAGKGRFLNNIKAIMERSKFVHEDWARVRFGAGTPWRRCWCVVSPPDEKEYAKAQKEQKKSSYERVKMPKGNIKFYETRKVTKKTRPIATIADAYAAYAIYPQSKPLIDQSTLVKLEGLVTIHTSPESTTEGFVFIMPEVHPAVSGFEMMLRFLFPVFDTFGLYGRPTRLIADSLDQRGLMFAMPRDRRYGYLDTLDVSGLIHTKGSQAWSERQWRREMKKLTGERMLGRNEQSPRNSYQLPNRRSMYAKTPSTLVGGVRFDDGELAQSSPGSRSASPAGVAGLDIGGLHVSRRADSASPANPTLSPHKRSVSEAQGYKRHFMETTSRLSEESYRAEEDDLPPQPPKHAVRPHGPGVLERINSGDEVPTISQNPAAVQALPPPQPVVSPPPLQHHPQSRPINQPAVAPELRRAHSNVDSDTLLEMQDASRQAADPQVGMADDQERRPTTVDRPFFFSGNLGTPTDISKGLVNDAHGYNAIRQVHPALRTAGKPNFNPAPAMELQQPDRGNSTQFATQRLTTSDALDSSVDTGLSQHTTTNVNSGLARKPVPQAAQDTQPTLQQALPRAESPVYSISTDAWEGSVIDEAALERILASDRNDTMQSAASSNPDYASTISSKHEQAEPRERPRAGKLKTTGDPDYRPTDLAHGGAGRLDTYAIDQAKQEQDVPVIDFGPTYTYKPTGRPGTAGTITPGTPKERRQRSRSGDRLRNASRDRLTTSQGIQSQSPGESNRQSYFGGRQTPSPIPNLVTGTNQNITAWQPASLSPGANQHGSGSLTPEQWVQQRAAMASQPQLAPPRKPVGTSSHNRHLSSTTQSELNTKRNHSRTPPPFVQRSPSADLSKRQATPPSRPHSRNASIHLNQYTAAVTPPTSLTAEEQMQIARATGTPMLNYTTNAQKKHQEQYAPGLFGALAARQVEKEQSKMQNRNSVVVEQEIAMRQQQQAVQAEQEYQMAAARQAQYQMQMHNYATQQQLQQVQQQQQQLQQQQQQQQHMFAAQVQAQHQQRAASPNWPLRQQTPELPRPHSGYYSTASSQWNLSPSSPSGPGPMRWEQQHAMMAQQPGGPQQYQQQQGRR